MTPEETELWIELMEKGLAIQHAVLESKVVLDKLPSKLRMDGINLLYCPVPDAAAGAGGRGGTIPE